MAENLPDTNVGNIKYIRKQDVVSRISDLLVLELKMTRCPTWNEVYNAIGDLPPADVAPVVHGEWLNAIFDSKHYRCSICNYHISNLVRENYCPNCGAKMDGGEND